MNVQAGVLQGSMLGPWPWTKAQGFIFLIYINDLSDNLTSNSKLLTDDTSLFSRVTDPNVTTNLINNYLHNINTWAYQ